MPKHLPSLLLKISLSIMLAYLIFQFAAEQSDVVQRLIQRLQLNEVAKAELAEELSKVQAKAASDQKLFRNEIVKVKESYLHAKFEAYRCEMELEAIVFSIQQPSPLAESPAVKAELGNMTQAPQFEPAAFVSDYSLMSAAAASPRRNQLTFLMGYGPLNDEKVATGGSVRFGLVSGVQYQYRISPNLHIGAQYTSNRQGLLGFGVEF